MYSLYCVLQPRPLNSGVKLNVLLLCFSTKKKFTLDTLKGEIHTEVYWQKYRKSRNFGKGQNKH